MNQGSVNKFKIYCCLLFLELHKTVNKGFSLICVMAESVFCLFCFCFNLNYDVTVENMVSLCFQQFDAKSFKTFAYFDNAKKRSQIEWLGGLRCCIFWTAFRCWKLQSVVKISFSHVICVIHVSNLRLQPVSSQRYHLQDNSIFVHVMSFGLLMCIQKGFDFGTNILEKIN